MEDFIIDLLKFVVQISRIDEALDNSDMATIEEVLTEMLTNDE